MLLSHEIEIRILLIALIELRSLFGEVPVLGCIFAVPNLYWLWFMLSLTNAAIRLL